MHRGIEADGTCSNCSRPFCRTCLAALGDRRYCPECTHLLLSQAAARGSAPGYAPQPARPPSAVDHVIPTRNPKALAAYYFGIFSLIPCVGLLLGPAAVTLGFLGLKARRENPELPGKAHAMVGIIVGLVTSLFNWGSALMTVVALVWRW
ncbi:MAG: DUF4190 domain-containing protein [Armatimonadota bacterium]